jgi:hypothetical protein
MYSQKVFDLFRKLATNGVGYEQIAHDLQISRSTAFIWRRLMNLPRRKCGPKGRK